MGRTLTISGLTLLQKRQAPLGGNPQACRQPGDPAVVDTEPWAQLIPGLRHRSNQGRGSGLGVVRVDHIGTVDSPQVIDARLEGVGYGPDKPLVPMPEPNEEEREKKLEKVAPSPAEEGLVGLLAGGGPLLTLALAVLVLTPLGLFL